MAKISRETLTRNDRRIDILLALFGDDKGNGWRNLSDDEKNFILDNHGLKVEIFANLKNFADKLTQKNKSWLNSLNNPAGGIDDARMIEEYGKEKTKAVNEITRFVISGALVTLSPHKLDKILEIINANEVEGLSNFSLGDK
jgi:hypothetical protein